MNDNEAIHLSIEKWQAIVNLKKELKDEYIDIRDAVGNIESDLGLYEYHAQCPLCELYNPYKKNRELGAITENHYKECPGCPLETIDKGCLNGNTDWNQFIHLLGHNSMECFLYAKRILDSLKKLADV